MRIYRWLLKLYPARFRENHEKEMLRAFADEAKERKRWRLWLWALEDLATTLPQRIAEEAWLDARSGMRQLIRRPWLAALTVSVLSLGIGSAVALLSRLEALHARTGPFRDPGRLVKLHLAPGTGRLAESPANLREWTRNSRYLESAALYAAVFMNVAAGGEVTRLRVSEGSANFFEVAGARPAWGRWFLPDEETPGRNDAAVISYALWDQAYGGDPAVLGKPVRLNGVPFRVVGVAPPGFKYPADTNVWTATVFDYPRVPKDESFSWELFGRLKPEMPLAEAQRLYREEALAGRNPAPPGFTDAPELRLMGREVAGRALDAAFVLLGAVFCLLLVACANVAHLLLTQSLDRRKELALRAALGASRARVFQQVLCEGWALALLAGLGGWAVAWLAAHGLELVSPGTGVVEVRWATGLLCLALSAAAAILFGALPAWHASRLEVNNDWSRAGGTRTAASGARTALLSVEVGLSVVLLTGAVALSRTYWEMVAADVGYDTNGVLTLRVATLGTVRNDADARRAYVQQGLERLRALPGVETAAALNYLPLAAEMIGISPWKIPGGGASASALTTAVTPGYFQALRTPVVAGRDLQASDGARGAMIAVVNEEFARSLGGAEAALGRVIRQSDKDPERVIAGVVRSSLHFGPGSKPLPQVYVPLEQADPRNITFVLKTRPGAPMQREWAAAALRSVDAGVPVFRVQSLESYLAERMAAPRFHTGALVFLSGMSALIALLGVYGAVSYSVTRKLPEYGVRMALGATPGRLRTLLAVRVLAPAGLAGVAGLIAAGMAGRFLQSLMYGVKTELWMEGGAAALALLSGAAMAALLAARSLGRLNPMTLLRAE